MDSLRARRLKLQHALEGLIDGFAEGLIDKDQFTSRTNRTKKSIAELDAKIEVDTGSAGQAERVRAAAVRLRELAATVGARLTELDWNGKWEIIRLLVQRIEVGAVTVRLVFRVIQDKPGSAFSQVSTFPRPARATKRS